MAEGLQAVDGTPIDVQSVEREFAQVMASDDTGTPAPPKVDPAEKAARAKEPPKRRGRPPKDEQARTSSKPAAEVVKADYTEDAQAAVSTVFTVAAVLPPTQPLAYVILQSSEALAKSLAEGAKHNATVRRLVSGGSDAGWKLQLAACGIQMAMATAQVYRDPQLREKASGVVQATLSKMLPEPEETGNGDSPSPEG